jgi:hypothetical protein
MLAIDKLVTDYYVFENKDVSNSNIKRRSVKIMIDYNLSKERIKNIISNAIKKIRIFHKNVKVIWVFIAQDSQDIDDQNYFCKAIWKSEKLSKKDDPGKFIHDEIYEKIKIKWNAEYKEIKKFFLKYKEN